VPVSDDCAHPNDWRESLDLDQGSHDRGDHSRRCRVHRNAKLAVVGIAGVRMDVHHLEDGQ
jgi:hypothetical protein